MHSDVPVKPTPAMRRFLTRLVLHGEMGRHEMGWPAYMMPLKMERAGWIACTYAPDTPPELRNQIWGLPRTYRITDSGRKQIKTVCVVDV